MLRLEFKEEFDCVSRAVTPSIKTLWLSGVLTLKKVKSINTNLFRLQHIASHCYQDQDHGQGGPLHPPILHYHPRRQHCPDRRSWVTLFRGSKLGEQHPGHDCDTGQSPGLRPFVDKLIHWTLQTDPQFPLDRSWNLSPPGRLRAQNAVSTRQTRQEHRELQQHRQLQLFQHR